MRLFSPCCTPLRMGCQENLSSPQWARSFCFLCFEKFSQFAPKLRIQNEAEKELGVTSRHR